MFETWVSISVNGIHEKMDCVIESFGIEYMCGFLLVDHVKLRNDNGKLVLFH